ncbi:hypothetical protein [uncultured Shimia sp.]|uniref:hypothetical protein n=1 Tax=uncultured Shimia sp. TaxID=573152 RepID=UPI00262454D5|nr:hypothetical protein [uncultured Shimia sp.]
MNANQLINMVTRMVMRRLINGGINAGINAASKAQKNRTQAEPGPWGEKSQAPKNAPQLDAKRAKQAMRVTRRIGRF